MAGTYYDSLKVKGISSVKKDEHSSTYTWIYKFEDSDTARDAVDEIRNELEQNEFEDYRNINVTQDGEFAVAHAEQDVENFE